jgi:hypothetical protein
MASDIDRVLINRKNIHLCLFIYVIKIIKTLGNLEYIKIILILKNLIVFFRK